MSPCPTTQQAFEQISLEFTRIFGEQKKIELTSSIFDEQVKMLPHTSSFDFDNNGEEQEIDPSEFADESDDYYDDWYDDNGTIFEQVP